MRLLTLCSCLVLAACATDAVRPTAVATMNMTQGLKTEMVAFAERQNSEIDRRHRAIARLHQDTQIAGFRGAKQRMDWRSTKSEEALRLYEEATRPGTGAGLAALLGQAPGGAFPASAVAVDNKQYDALLKALKPLSSKGSTMDEVKFLIGFGQAVVDQMKADLKAAAQEDATGGSAAPSTAPQP